MVQRPARAVHRGEQQRERDRGADARGHERARRWLAEAHAHHLGGVDAEPVEDRLEPVPAGRPREQRERHAHGERRREHADRRVLGAAAGDGEDVRVARGHPHSTAADAPAWRGTLPREIHRYAHGEREAEREAHPRAVVSVEHLAVELGEHEQRHEAHVKEGPAARITPQSGGSAPRRAASASRRRARPRRRAARRARGRGIATSVCADTRTGRRPVAVRQRRDRDAARRPASAPARRRRRARRARAAAAARRLPRRSRSLPAI